MSSNDIAMMAHLMRRAGFAHHVKNLESGLPQATKPHRAIFYNQTKPLICPESLANENESIWLSEGAAIHSGSSSSG